MMTVAELREHLAEHRWIYAKTMPENPHEYTLREDWDEDLFVRVVEYIREHGYESWYRKRRYIYLDAGEHFYWTMGAPIAVTILINRKRIGGYSAEQLQEMMRRP